MMAITVSRVIGVASGRLAELHQADPAASAGPDQGERDLLNSDRKSLDAPSYDVVRVVALFFLGEIAPSRLLHVLSLRDRPY